MIDQKPNRRASDGAVNVLAERIDGLCSDMSEMKHGITKMADALTKLAVVEERQTQTILAQERAFKALERVEAHQRQHEAACREQEKELRSSIEDVRDGLDRRVTELEKAEPMQQQTSQWVSAAVWGSLALIATYIGPRLLEKVFG